MFIDFVSHRLSNGVEARADALYLSIHTGAIIDWWFDFPDSPAQLIALLPWEADSWAYKWPWEEAAKYLRYEKGKPWIMRSDTEYGRRGSALICGTKPKKEQHPTRRLLNRIAAILCDDDEGFKVLHWCLTTMGGRND